MASNRPDFRVTSTEKYVNSNGEEKTNYTDVGSGWKNSKGGVSIKLRANLAVSGELVLFPATDKPAAADDDADNGIPL